MNQDLNITLVERILRHGVGWAMVLLVLLLPTTPPWLAVVAIYPLLTAIIGWDPFYYAFQRAVPPRQTRVAFQARHAHM